MGKECPLYERCQPQEENMCDASVVTVYFENGQAGLVFRASIGTLRELGHNAYHDLGIGWECATVP